MLSRLSQLVAETNCYDMMVFIYEHLYEEEYNYENEKPLRRRVY